MLLSVLEMMHCLKIGKFITEFVAAADEGLELTSKRRIREDEGRAGDALNIQREIKRRHMTATSGNRPNPAACREPVDLLARTP